MSQQIAKLSQGIPSTKKPELGKQESAKAVIDAAPVKRKAGIGLDEEDASVGGKAKRKKAKKAKV